MTVATWCIKFFSVAFQKGEAKTKQSIYFVLAFVTAITNQFYYGACRVNFV